MLYIIPILPVRKLRQWKGKELAQSLPVTRMAPFGARFCALTGAVCVSRLEHLLGAPGHTSPKAMLAFFGIT